MTTMNGDKTLWRVKGADSATGGETSFDVRAQTREQAEGIANAKGMLVESVDAVPTLDYRNQTDQRTASRSVAAKDEPPGSSRTHGILLGIVAVPFILLMLGCFVSWLSATNQVIGVLYLIAGLLCVIIVEIKW